MNNIVYAILPFLLFGAVLGLLLKGRFPRAVTAGVYSGAFAFDAAIHLALGFLRADNSLLLGYVEDCPKRPQMDGYCGLCLALLS